MFQFVVRTTSRGNLIPRNKKKHAISYRCFKEFANDVWSVIEATGYKRTFESGGQSDSRLVDLFGYATEFRLEKA